MTVLRLDNISIVVDDLQEAVDFFVELGLSVRGPEGIIIALAEALR